MKAIYLSVLALAFGSSAFAGEKKPIDFFEIYNEAKQMEAAIGDRGVDRTGNACKFSVRLDPNNGEGEEGNYALWFFSDFDKGGGLMLYVLSQMKFELTESTLPGGTLTKEISYKGKTFLQLDSLPGVLKRVKVGTEDAADCAVYN